MKLINFETLLPFTTVKVNINENIYLLVHTDGFLGLREINNKTYISGVITYICGESDSQKIHIKKIIKANNLKLEKIDKSLINHIIKYFYKADPLIANSHNLYFDLEKIEIIYDPFKQIKNYEKSFMAIGEEYFENIYSDYIKLFIKKGIEKDNIGFYGSKATNLQKTSSKDYDFLIKGLDNFRIIKKLALKKNNVLLTNKFNKLTFDIAKFNRDQIGKVTIGVGYCDVKVVPSQNEKSLTHYLIHNNKPTGKNILLTGIIKYDNEVLCSPGSFTILDENSRSVYKVLFVDYEYCGSLWKGRKGVIYGSLATSEKGDKIVIVHNNNHFIIGL